MGFHLYLIQPRPQKPLLAEKGCKDIYALRIVRQLREKDDWEWDGYRMERKGVSIWAANGAYGLGIARKDANPNTTDLFDAPCSNLIISEVNLGLKRIVAGNGN